MTTLVSRLEDEGWVKRQPDPNDGRAVNVVLTKPGSRMLEQATAARTKVLQKRLERLSPAERRALADAVGALRTLTRD
jgi:DNA-binding MarR family transcriptional regulator